MKRNYWTRTKVLGLAALMEKPTLVKEDRKAASLEATRKQETAGNGAVKASAPEETHVHGRHLTLRRRRREAAPRVPTKTLAIPRDNLEKEAGQDKGGSLRSGGKAHDQDVEPRRMAPRTDPPATPT